MSKEKYYSRMEQTPLTRALGFGYDYTVWEFDFVHGNYSTDFKLSLVTNDTIILGRIERLNWKNKIQQTTEFAVNEPELTRLGE